MVAAPSWQIPAGAVISILKLSPDQERWLKDGVIVLLHDASERGDHAPVAASAVPEIVARARENRLEVVPLAEWVA